MSSFTFSVGGKTVKGKTEEIRGSSGSRFKAEAACPFCGKKTKVGDNPGINKTKAKAEGDLRSELLRHYEGQHK